MNAISLFINDSQFDVGLAWVHMQEIEGKENASYRVIVPKSHCVSVFDPRNSKQSEISWKEFLMEEVDALGTFILSGYFENMAKINGCATKGCPWVIATLDDVVEDAETIELLGKAVVFDQKRI
jgi:hypothetical protein